jgi:hypothetical protein
LRLSSSRRTCPIPDPDRFRALVRRARHAALVRRSDPLALGRPPRRGQLGHSGSGHTGNPHRDPSGATARHPAALPTQLGLAPNLAVTLESAGFIALRDRGSEGEALLRTAGGARAPDARGQPDSYGRLWRTSANEPTTLITTAPLRLLAFWFHQSHGDHDSRAGIVELILTAATSQWGIESEHLRSAQPRAGSSHSAQ